MPFSSTLEVIVCAVPCDLTHAGSLVELLYYLVSGKILRLNKNLVNVIHPTGRILSNFSTIPSDFLDTIPCGFLPQLQAGFWPQLHRFSRHNSKRVSCQTHTAFTVICESNTRNATNALKFARKKPGNAWLKIQVVPPPGFEPGTY